MSISTIKDFATRLQIINRLTEREIYNIDNAHGHSTKTALHRLLVIKIVEGGEDLYQGMDIKHVRSVCDIVAEAYMTSRIGTNATTEDYVMMAAKTCPSATFEIGYLYSEQIRNLLALLLNGKKMQAAIANSSFMMN